MNTTTIRYQTKTAAEKNIFHHLVICSGSFVPPLKERVDIEAYSKKIAEKAISFEAWNNNELVGLIAAYFNDDIVKSCFITNVSVTKEFTGKGIASILLNNCIEYCTGNKCFEIYLEVYWNNIPAINFYKKFNFIQSDKKGDNLILKLDIKNNR